MITIYIRKREIVIYKILNKKFAIICTLILLALFNKDKIIDKYIDLSISFSNLETTEQKIEHKLNLLNKFNNIQNSGEFNINTDKAVFYIPHQDDETLFFSSIIINTINKLGSENVYMVLVSDGSSANYKDLISDELNNYLKQENLFSDNKSSQRKLRDEVFSSSRTDEFNDATKSLGAISENIFYLNYKDGNLYDYTLEFQDIVKTIDKKFNKDVTHITYSPYLDSHDDHKSLGSGLLNLYLSSDIDDVYFVVKDFFAKYIPDYKLITSTVNDSNDLSKITEAINAYNIYDESIGRFSIGYGSAKNLFKNLELQVNSNEVLSYIHPPSINLYKLIEKYGHINWNLIFEN